MTRRSGLKATVFGGAGFIGSNLVRALLARGDRVTVLDDLSTGRRANLADLAGVEFLEGSILDQDAVERAVDGAQIVFHLAASVGNTRSIEDPVRDSEVNVIGTIRVLEAARAAAVQRLVYSSSAAIFGELKHVPVAEEHPIEPTTPYGASKLAGEKLALAYAALYDLEVTCLRYFNVYGPQQHFDAYGNAIPIFVFQMLRGDPVTVFGDGEQTRDFVHVDDVAQANLRAAETTSPSGAFNIGSGERISINRLTDLIAERVGGEIEIRHGPERPGDVRHSLADTRASVEGFGFAPRVSIADGLSDYVAWARRQPLPQGEPETTAT